MYYMMSHEEKTTCFSRSGSRLQTVTLAAILNIKSSWCNQTPWKCFDLRKCNFHSKMLQFLLRDIKTWWSSSAFYITYHVRCTFWKKEVTISLWKTLCVCQSLYFVDWGVHCCCCCFQFGWCQCADVPPSGLADENFTRTSLEVQGVQRGVARRGAPFEISIMIYTSTLHVWLPSSWSTFGAATPCTDASSQPP